MTPLSAEILAVTPAVIGPSPGYDQARVDFEFDRQVSRWALRVGSYGPHDGALAAQGEAIGTAGFGRQPLGTTPFGQAVEGVPVRFGSLQVPATALRHGANILTLYGQLPDGRWA